MAHTDNSLEAAGKGTARRSFNLLLAGFVVLASGCVSVPERTPLPQDLVEKATVPGGEYARYWGDEEPPYADAWLDLSKDGYPWLKAPPGYDLEAEVHSR